MSHRDEILERAGCKKYNTPVKTPDHPTKTHIVVATENGRTKVIRFGKKEESIQQSNRKPVAERLSSAYWKDRVKK